MTMPATIALPPACTLPAVARSMCFDHATFSTNQFAQCNVVRPDHIAGSVRRRQAEYLAGRLCARACLAAYGHITDVGTGALREPIWPRGLTGSITHNDNRAAAVVTRAATCAGIGIDIETIFAAGTGLHLRGLVVQDRELRLLHQLGGHLGLHHWLALVFSAKESFFKAAFAQVQRYFEFDAVELHDIDTARGTLAFTVREPLSAALAPGVHVEAAYSRLDAHTVMTACVLPPPGCQAGHAAEPAPYASGLRSRL